MTSPDRTAEDRAVDAGARAAARPSEEHDVLAALAGSVAALVLALVVLPVREALGAANEGMLLLVVVMVAATAGGRRAGLVTSVVGAAAFSATQATPGIEARSTVTLVLMVLVGLIVGSRTRRARIDHADARALRRSLEAVHDATGLVAAGATADEVARWARGPLQEVLRDGTEVDPGSLMSPHARGGFVHIEVPGLTIHLCAPDGPTGSWPPGVLDRFDDGTGGRLEVPIASGGERLGRIVLEPGPGRSLSPDARTRVALVAAQVALAASHPCSGTSRTPNRG